ncbi:alkaline phosphatase family protein [Ferrimonas marina]|uniref:Predicted pyrophosphatase or phosphodiesterase, AlkP superfamily n=1 Tax=Ferrimonas marina TaxID=299255 RepID=A0A1M5YRS5_9GAMM|nr:ectonucleotide pyrophosphatase/phosphodiesterase [Ferrimonas marina]SHI14755.1 Predicted pyrophosphatase or phosphodiesterase, AlkP superfamily [Ferrimonas marina]
MRLIFGLIFAAVLAGCSSNEPASEARKPHLLLVSIDGYRYDYTELHQPPFLSQFEQQSAMVERMAPSYPTKTFPNHLTLVTGLLPENHGIVSNGFHNPALGEDYFLSRAEAVTNGDFYDGVPLWSLAASQQMKSATYFWPGSEAEIAGFRPDYWVPYNHVEDYQIRIDQLVEWFQLPDDERPQFMTLYFHEVDSQGHYHGATSEQARDALHKVDAALSQLVERLNAVADEQNLDLNIIITSDHGMLDLEKLDRVYMDEVMAQEPGLSERMRLIGTGPVTQIYAQGDDKQADLDKMIALFQDIPNVEIYKREDIPMRLRFKGHVAIGDAIILSNRGYLDFAEKPSSLVGNHGFETAEVPEMNTLLMGVGPAFESGARIEAADNIHVYPMMAQILGLTIEHEIDGDEEVLQPLLAK